MSQISDEAAEAESQATQSDRVGYKRPPKHSRFTKGRSGNPLGRRKKSKTQHAQIVKVFSDPVTLREGSRTFTVPATAGMAMALRNQALKGNVRAAELCLKLAEKFEQFKEEPVSYNPLEDRDFLDRLSDSSLEEIVRIYREMRAEAEQKKKKLN